MFRTKKVFVITLLALLALTGCAKSPATSNKDVVSFPKTEVTKAKTLTDFKTVPASDLLNNSVALPSNDGYRFIPTYFTDQGFVLGELDSLTNDQEKYFAYFDVNTMKYQIVKQLAKSPYSSLAVISASDQYIVFCTLDTQGANKGVIYVYDTQKKTCTKILETEAQRMRVFGSIYKDDVYFSVLEKENYVTYEYQIKTKKLKKLSLATNSNFPIRIQDDLYYVSKDAKKETIALQKMNLKTNAKKTMFTRDAKNNAVQFTAMCNDGNELYIFIADNTNVYCYKLDTKSNKMELYFQQDKLEYPLIRGGYMTFSKVASGENRVHPHEYVLDLHNNINYDYQDSIIMPSKKGIVWVKFCKNEKDIPKGALFTNQNTKMMYKEFK